jgi:hypothetical protein
MDRLFADAPLNQARSGATPVSAVTSQQVVLPTKGDATALSTR